MYRSRSRTIDLVPFVLAGAIRIARFADNNNNPAGFVDFNARHLDAGRGHGFDGPGNVGLLELAGIAAHDAQRRLTATGKPVSIASVWELAGIAQLSIQSVIGGSKGNTFT
jgi:hypothetical protein